MMCGVLVVSSCCGDTVNDLVRDGIDGHLIDDYKDYNAFAEKIAPLLLDGAMLLAFSDKAVNSPNIMEVERLVSLWKLPIDATRDMNKKSRYS